YDFDYSGLINASYAEPGWNLGIKSVTERYYLGLCREEHEFVAGIGYMEEYMEEIVELLHSFPYLDEKTKNSMIAYIEGYFFSASAPGFIDQKLRSTCR
ncbi:MAG: hypothetical protein GY790_03225, partial [Bacteroidetes bacterium]|nr:hypothetical protein [Bacteroidota bacterium]